LHPGVKPAHVRVRGVHGAARAGAAAMAARMEDR
jgi:hypothetical protein